MTGRVVVVGSINRDLNLWVQRFPRAGETVQVLRTTSSTGGKGANQAAAASHHGANVVFLGAVGTDDGGTQAISDLHSASVDVSWVRRVDDVETGMAIVFRDGDGENMIAVSMNANEHIDTSWRPRLARHDVLVCQSEIGSATIARVADLANQFNCRMVLNLGPVVDLGPETLQVANPLVVNEHEARDLLRRLTGKDIRDPATATSMLVDFAPSICVTAGSAGAFFNTRNAQTGLCPAPEVSSVVDTAGAGDAFVGALASSLAAGGSLGESVAEGCRYASAHVQTEGAFMQGPVS